MARFTFHDNVFGRPSVKVMPGEYFVWNEDISIQTVLGSCVAVCLHDPRARVGGMNHFLLPASRGTAREAPDAARYGVHAMEVLINQVIKLGAMRTRLIAKVFGGAAVISGMTQTNIGQQNVAFIDQFLATERIPVQSRDMLEIYPRRVVFFPANGQAMVKRLPPATGAEVHRQEVRAISRAPAATAGGSVELF